METRQPGEHGEGGYGEVHSHISQPDKGQGLSGGYDPTRDLDSDEGSSAEEMVGQARERAGAMVDDAKEQAEEITEQVRNRAGQLRDRAGETLGQAREKAGQALDRAEDELEERTGIVTLIRENPIPALGAAFAVGYLMAGSRRQKRGKLMNMATGQLRGAIMGGISAALASELRSLAREQGGTLASLFGGSQEDESTSDGGRYTERANRGTTGTRY